MHDNSIQILCTRPIETFLKEALKEEQIIIEEIAFIETTPITNEITISAIEQAILEKATIIFTSMNAVEAVADRIENKNLQWNIYCIGTTTNELVKNYFGAQSIAGTADSAAALARLMVTNNSTTSCTFFCGDQRREELPEILTTNNIAVKEIVVYKTIPMSNKITKAYDGILFFSPSAVNSFFSVNKISSSTILFAIGTTTEQEIKLFSSNKVIVSDVPGKENLVNTMSAYFSKKRNAE